MECPICYIEITPEVNYTITSCKHTFCMNCFISSVLQNNLCPCCRSELYVKKEDDETVSEYYSEDETTTEYTESEEDHYFRLQSPSYFEPIASMEEIVKNIEEKGYTILDLMQLIIPQREYKEPNENTYDIVAEALNECIEKADFDAKIAYYELQMMEKEDYDSYTNEMVCTVTTFSQTSPIADA